MERTAAQTSAFLKCKAAREAALARKKEAKAAASAAAAAPLEQQQEPPEPPAVQPAPMAPPQPVLAQQPELLPAPAPAPEPRAQLAPVYESEEDDFDVVDVSEMCELIRQQGETLTALRDELHGMRAAQQDLSTSFTKHGVTTQYALNFV